MMVNGEIIKKMELVNSFTNKERWFKNEFLIFSLKENGGMINFMEVVYFCILTETNLKGYLKMARKQIKG